MNKRQRILLWVLTIIFSALSISRERLFWFSKFDVALLLVGGMLFLDFSDPSSLSRPEDASKRAKKKILSVVVVGVILWGMSKLGAIASDVGSIKYDVGSIESDVGSIEPRLMWIEHKIESIQSDVSSIQIHQSVYDR